jgi:hypothetical protein
VSDEERREHVGNRIRRERKEDYLLILLSFRIWDMKNVHEALQQVETH